MFVLCRIILRRSLYILYLLKATLIMYSYIHYNYSIYLEVH